MEQKREIIRSVIVDVVIAFGIGTLAGLGGAVIMLHLSDRFGWW